MFFSRKMLQSCSLEQTSGSFDYTEISARNVNSVLLSNGSTCRKPEQLCTDNGKLQNHKMYSTPFETGEATRSGRSVSSGTRGDKINKFELL